MIQPGPMVTSSGNCQSLSDFSWGLLSQWIGLGVPEGGRVALGLSVRARMAHSH